MPIQIGQPRPSPGRVTVLETAGEPGPAGAGVAWAAEGGGAVERSDTGGGRTVAQPASAARSTLTRPAPAVFFTAGDSNKISRDVGRYRDFWWSRRRRAKVRPRPNTMSRAAVAPG